MKIRILLIHNFLSFRPLTWFSFLIRVFTGSRWNHNALELETEQGRYVLESVGKGVIYTPWEEWVRHSKRIVLPLTVAVPETSLNRLQTLIGKPYGFRDILRIIKYIILNRWLGRNTTWKGVAYSKRGYICSEVVAELLGLDTSILYVPGDFEHLPQLSKGIEFRT